MVRNLFSEIVFCGIGGVFSLQELANLFERFNILAEHVEIEVV